MRRASSRAVEASKIAHRRRILLSDLGTRPGPLGPSGIRVAVTASTSRVVETDPSSGRPRADISARTRWRPGSRRTRYHTTSGFALTAIAAAIRPRPSTSKSKLPSASTAIQPSMGLSSPKVHSTTNTPRGVSTLGRCDDSIEGGEARRTGSQELVKTVPGGGNSSSAGVDPALQIEGVEDAKRTGDLGR